MHETAEVAYEVGQLTRVEGEGSLSLTVRDGEVIEARLGIFEAPRYFERLVVGRTPDELIDIVARICGICPVAYQMSAVHAFERLFGVAIDPEVRRLRRLFYCGEWIESHALHIHLLHAPDFLGYASAIELAADHPEVVERGLRMKRLGNRLVALIGGRAIHPVSVRVGGISRPPDRGDLDAIRRELPAAIRDAQETVRWAAGLTPPPYARSARLVALRHPVEYPMNEGRIVSSDGLDLDVADWPLAFEERQVPWSNALQALSRDGKPYLLGPTARVALAGSALHPLAADALRATGLGDELVTNVFRSIVARSVELLHAFAEASDILDALPVPGAHLVTWEPRPGIAAWATEAPRGLLFHRYEVGEDGLIDHATIVPPTSQNQAAIEHDLRLFAPSVLDLPHAEATHRLEQLIRSYDPCISCATHFLDLRVEGTRACA
jgi:coenzyme F420-reducing hydrogenase alpha subunit